MHIPQDVVDLIVDQLSLLAGYKWRRHLRDVSLVSTAWVNRSQHHLFSTIELNNNWKIKEWCSRIKPDPGGVSRHVRVLVIGRRGDPIDSPLKASDIKIALPHLVSFKNLQELTVGTVCTSLGVLSSVLSSSPRILKLHRWTRQNVGIHETWKDISTVINLLPNLTHVSLSDHQGEISEIHIQLSVDEGSSLAIKCFKFHGLEVLDLHKFGVRNLSEYDRRVFQTLLEACRALQELKICYIPGIAQFLGSIPSSSVSLIHISNPLGIGDAPMTYSDSWPWESFEEFEYCVPCLNNENLAEFTHLGVSIRKIARRYSDNHSGLKTRVRATLDLTELEIRAVENGEAPFYKTRLEEELKDHVHVDFELILVARRRHGDEVESGTEA